MPDNQKKRSHRNQPRRSSSVTATSSRDCSSSDLVETLEHRRFAEFCNACKRYRYIGLCFGAPGVGKTVSARHYTAADHARKIHREPAVFYTCPVVASPGKLERDINQGRVRFHNDAIERVRQREDAKMLRLLDRAQEMCEPRRNPNGYRSKEAKQAEDAFHEQRARTMRIAKTVADPTALVVIDEADRLKMAGLEQVRDIFDGGGIGMVLIGMPGLEKRLARFPQFYSRIGFVHEFRRLAVKETRQLLEQQWTPPGVTLPDGELDKETVAAIIRITGGNFRLLNRLITQVERILEVNELTEVTKTVVEAARESLVIGPA